MILGFLSSSLSTGPKPLSVESGFNSSDLYTQLLVEPPLLNKPQTTNTVYLVDLALLSFLCSQ